MARALCRRGGSNIAFQFPFGDGNRTGRRSVANPRHAAVDVVRFALRIPVHAGRRTVRLAQTGDGEEAPDDCQPADCRNYMGRDGASTRRTTGLWWARLGKSADTPNRSPRFSFLEAAGNDVEKPQTLCSDSVVTAAGFNGQARRILRPSLSGFRFRKRL